MLDYIFTPQAITSLVILIVAIAASAGLRFVFKKLRAYNTEHGLVGSSRDRVFTIFLNIARYVVYFLAVLGILEVNGIDVGGLAAGLGVAGIIVGFALQDFFSDIVMGLRIITDTYFHVGDFIKFGDITGRVMSISPQSVKIAQLDGSITSVSNRNITQVTVLSHENNYNVSFPYEVEAVRARKVMQTIAERAAQLPNIESARFRGTAELADCAILYRLQFYCDPANMRQCTRDVNGLVQDVFAEEGLSFPYPHLDISQV